VGNSNLVIGLSGKLDRKG